MSIKILLADDHKIVRDGLRSLIDKQSDMEVIAEAEDGRTTVKLAKELKPDIVIMDITMPDLNGIDATQQIINEISKIKVIGLSMHSDKRFVSGILKAGASAYLLKECDFNEMVHAIKTVLDDEIYLSPKIASVVIQDYLHSMQPTVVQESKTLTLREREVLQLLAEGKSNKEIASELFVSVKTVETHRHRIMSKLNINNIADLIKYAIREGLTSF
jgi:DNA-binding NarL/FixJ family response regulator